MLQQQSHLLHCGGVVPVARPAGRFLLPVASPAGRFLLPPSSSSCSRAGSSSTTACVHAVEHSCSTSGRSSTPWKNATRALHQLHHQVPRAYSTEGSLQLHQHPQYQHQQLYQNQELQTGCPDSSGTTTTTTTRQRHQRQLSSLVLASSVLSALSLAWPNTASASGGALTGGALDLFRQFLGGVEGLGPWGPVVFLLVVMICEMVPLFPTQPLSLASGLLFGAVNGAILMLLGVTLAAVNAFLIARGVGRPLAQKVIDWEMRSHGGGEGPQEGGGGMAGKMSDVQRTIERGGLWQQIGAITLLRLTPVVPFSASNYLLGLTPVQLPAFLGGTLGGMAVWSVLYASLGGASRKLLDNGADIGSLLTDLGGKASAMSANVAGYSLIAIGGVAAVYFLRSLIQRNSSSTNTSMPLANAEGGSQSTASSWQQQQQQQQQPPPPVAQQQGQPSGTEASGSGDAAAVAGARAASQAPQLRGSPQTNETLQNK